MPECRVLIVEDHPLFRDALRAMLDGLPGVHVVAMADTADDAVRLAVEHLPDVVVMDLALAAGSGVEATARIRRDCPETRILVLTSYADDARVFAALRAGAHSYLLKTAPPREIAQAVITTATGDSVYHGGVARRMTDQLWGGRTASSAAFPALTAREHDVLDLVARGYDNTTIADRLVLSLKTVRNNVSTIFTKLGVASRAEAVARARDAGLGAPPGNPVPEGRDLDL
jgi:DNA-binding NarL/FixJ family response regulator